MPKKVTKYSSSSLILGRHFNFRVREHEGDTFVQIHSVYSAHSVDAFSFRAGRCAI